MSQELGYDETEPLSIEAYGQRMIGKTFADICDEDDLSANKIVLESIKYDASHSDKNRKGGLGELIEERFFHYHANGEARADFDKAGVELKVTPYKINKDGSLSAKERLVLTMIDYCAVVNETFEESHLWLKARLILLVYYLFQEEIVDRLCYKIHYVKLFTPPEEDVKIIRHDFRVIQDKIRAGLAHELSESDTLYLGAVTKAANSRSRRAQPYSDVPAKPRAFSFKTTYMTYVLTHYIATGKDTYEPVIKGAVDQPFEDYVVAQVDRYRGYTIDDLCSEFNIEFSKGKGRPKNLGAMLAFRILGVKGNNAEEFVKANVVVKTIRVAKNNTIKENMSFPAFKFKELVREDWEDSTFGNYLRETRFLFIVYKFDAMGELRLMGCQFWNMPYRDLEDHVRKVWEKTKDIIKEGIEIDVKNGTHYNNLPKATEDSVCHVRPHGKDSNDKDELPNGRMFPKQCFWLNRGYILEQLDRSLYES